MPRSPDLVGPGLRLLFVGINPGLWTAATGDPLRPPRQPLLPGAAAGRDHRPRHRPRRRDDRRPTGPTSSLAASASPTSWPGPRRGRPSCRAPSSPPAARRLERFVAEHRPVVVAVAGVTAYRDAFGRRDAATGRQPETLGGAVLWVVPNPSGLNAHETIDSLAAAYRGGRDRCRHRRCRRLIAPRQAATRSASSRLARYQSIVARRPSSNGMVASPAEQLLGPAGVDAPAGLAVGLGGVPPQLAGEADESGDGLDRLADRDLVVGAEVDRLGIALVDARRRATMASAASSTYRYSRLAEPVPHTSTLSVAPPPRPRRTS